MVFVTLFIILMLVILVFVVGIVYCAVSYAQKSNKEYQAFASLHGYQFDRAQGNDYYRDYSKKKMDQDRTITPFQSPCVEKYANFTHYPFGRGHERKVAYVISGAYKDWQFRAFTYHFVGNTMEQTGPGGVFSVVMIECHQPLQVQLPEQVFYENGVLCDYQHENLNVETLHDRIEKLGELAKVL